MSDKRLMFYGMGSFYFSNGRKYFDGSNWISNKALEIFKYLVFKRKRKVKSEELIEVFWPESELKHGKKLLYDTIYLLRKSLIEDGLNKEIVESSNGNYNINSSYNIWTDWTYFNSRIDKLLRGEEKVGIDKLKALFEFYRGDFLSDSNYAEWPIIYREELRQKYLELIEIITEKLYKKNNYLAALSYINKGIDYDPYREKFYLLKLKILNKLGRIAEAIKCYKECEKVLKEELGVQPKADLKEELRHIKNNHDFEEKQIYKNVEADMTSDAGAMECSTVNELKSILELEMRQGKRSEFTDFLLIKIEFENNKIESKNLNKKFDKLTEELRSIIRMGDFICPANNQIFLILYDIDLDNSGIIIKRFSNLFKQFSFSKTPKLDIKEIN